MAHWSGCSSPPTSTPNAWAPASTVVLRLVRHAAIRRLDCHQIPVMPSHLPGPDHRGMEPRRHALGPVTVSRIGFGAMQLPGPGVFGPPRDRTAALAVLRRAVELGVDHIDTAQYYGPDVANQLICEALHPYPAQLALVSKVGAARDDTGGW